MFSIMVWSMSRTSVFVAGGQGGSDLLYGGTHADTLYGGDNTDHLYGEDGADTVEGGVAGLVGGDHEAQVVFAPRPVRRAGFGRCQSEPALAAGRRVGAGVRLPGSVRQDQRCSQRDGDDGDVRTAWFHASILMVHCGRDATPRHARRSHRRRG